MKTATATYIAPPGDNKVCEMGGVTFFDGQPVDLNSYDHGHLISKLEGNQHFDIEVGAEKPDEHKPKRGRPSNADKAAKAAEPKLNLEQQQAAQLSNQQGTAATNVT